MTKFYKTTFTIEVLSEGPLGDCLSLSQIDYAISEGDCVGGNLTANEIEISAKQVADTLYVFGSTPSFFNLDDEGNSLDERDDE